MSLPLPPFRALEGQMAGSRNRYLAREEVPANVWCAIIEHCACVDGKTGAFAPRENLPCRKLSPFAEPVARHAFAA